MKSIVSDEFLSQIGQQEIKPSNIRIQDKVVLKWTPVVLGTAFPRITKAQKLNYSTEYLLHSGEAPPSVQELPECPIISMPLTNIQQHLENLIDLRSLAPDDELVFNLEQHLYSVRQGQVAALASRSGTLSSSLQLRKADKVWEELEQFLHK